MTLSPLSDVASISSSDISASSSSISSSSSSSTKPPTYSGTRHRKSLRRTSGVSPKSKWAHDPFPITSSHTPPLLGVRPASLNTATHAAHHLVAADDLIVRIFDDPRSRLRVRTLGHPNHTHEHAHSHTDHAQFKARFRAAFRGGSTNTVRDLQCTAQEFARRMQDLGLIQQDEETALAFSNLSLRYAQLKYYSTRVQMSHVVINDKLQSGIVATADIPKGVLIHELDGLMSSDSIHFGFASVAGSPGNATSLGGNCPGNRKRKRDPQPQFNMYSVIRKSPEQSGPGHADRLLVGPARFVNHSCRPNCRLKPFRRTNAWGIETSKDILTGEEITVSYGKEYFEPGECACASCGTATPPPQKAQAQTQARDTEKCTPVSLSSEHIRVPYPSPPAESSAEYSAPPRKRNRGRV